MGFIRNCWITALQIKETLAVYRDLTTGKESFPISLDEEDFAYPFPMNKPEDGWSNHPMQSWMDGVHK